MQDLVENKEPAKKKRRVEVVSISSLFCDDSNFLFRLVVLRSQMMMAPGMMIKMTSPMAATGPSLDQARGR